MKLKLNHIIYLVALVLAIVVLQQCGRRRKLKSDKNRLESNITVLHDSIKNYKAKNGQLVAEVHALNLNKKEFKELYPELYSHIKNIGVKLNQLESYTSSQIETKTYIKTLLHDSLIFDTTHVKMINFDSRWLKMNGYIHKDSMFSNHLSIVPLDQVIYDDRSIFRKRVLFWTKPRLIQNMSSKNPNASIIYSKHINLLSRKEYRKLK